MFATLYTSKSSSAAGRRVRPAADDDLYISYTDILGSGIQTTETK